MRYNIQLNGNGLVTVNSSNLFKLEEFIQTLRDVDKSETNKKYFKGYNGEWLEMTKHIGITANSEEELAEKMNEVQQNYNVFASQTHVTVVADCLIFSAICFAKD